VFWLLDPSGFTGIDWKVAIFLFTILMCRRRGLQHFPAEACARGGAARAGRRLTEP